MHIRILHGPRNADAVREILSADAVREILRGPRNADGAHRILRAPQNTNASREILHRPQNAHAAREIPLGPQKRQCGPVKCCAGPEAPAARGYCMALKMPTTSGYR